MANIIVLGGGLVGLVMARDLAADKDINVTVADLNPSIKEHLTPHGIEFVKADLSDADTVTQLIQGYDLVIGSLPGFLGFKNLETVIRAGKDIVDISFMPEDAMALDGLAKEHGITAVVDCGVAPGMSNMIPGYVDSILDKTTDLTIMVGGLPKERSWPYEYKAPFSPIDVLEEYTRPARLVRDGKLVVLPALSEPELVDFPDIGTLEAFNTDGLRSLIFTIDAPNMKEKTMRYPGHIELMRVLRETGFFSQENIELKDGTQVKPLDLTTRLLFPMWKLGPEDREFTVMRVEVSGLKDDKQVTYVYDLMDRYDEDTGFSSMSRTTGFPAVIMARQVLAGRFTDKGVFPPEFLGRDHELFRLVLAELTKRGVAFTERIETA